MNTLLILFFSSFIQAQTAIETPAMVQFAEGNSTLKTSSTPLKYPDLIHDGDQVLISQNSKLKLFFKNKCTVVFYDKNEVIINTASISPTKGAFRIACNESMVVNFNNLNLKIQSGEVLVTENEIVPIEGTVELNGKKIEPNQSISISNVSESKTLSESDLADLDKKFPLHKESYRHAILDSKPKNFTTRFFLMYTPGGTAGTKHKFNSYNLKDRDVESARIGAHFKMWEKDFFAFLGYLEMRSDNNNYYFMGPPPVGYNNSRSSIWLTGIGLRHSDFKKSHSLYYYLSLAQHEIEYSVKDTTFTEYFGKVVYYDVAAGAGYDKIFFINNRFSAIVGVELIAFQSLGPGWEARKSSWGTHTDNPVSEQTSYAAFVYFGPVIQF